MTMTPEVFACGVEVCGRANLETFIATMPATWSLDRMAMKLGDPRTEAGRALLKARSPYNFANQVKRPVLIAQGADDSRVPQAEADRLVEVMIKNGVKEESRYVGRPRHLRSLCGSVQLVGLQD